LFRSHGLAPPRRPEGSGCVRRLDRHDHTQPRDGFSSAHRRVRGAAREPAGTRRRGRARRCPRRPRGDSRVAGGVPRDIDAPACGRVERTGDRDANGTDARLGAREPAPRHETAAREAATMSDDLSRDDYLWTAAGEPDPEIARLEALLAPYAHRGTLPPLPARAPRRRALHVVLPIVTAAASLALVIAAAWFTSTARPPGSWSVQSLAGAPAVAGSPIAGPSRLAVGQALTTDAQSRARIAVGEIGRVDVEPNSRVRLIRSRPGEHRMALDRGRIAAQIWAPPRYFFVTTPSATAIDLGCAYTLDVDAAGAGMIRVTHGWVAFEYEGRESFIPQGAV